MPSSVIRSYRYDRARHELRIVFQSLRTYTYAEVPEATYAGLLISPSKGEFFNQHIRGKYPFTRH